MKTLLLLIALILPCAAQSVFSNGMTVHSGNGDDQKSKAYEFKGPYVLQWSLRDLPPSKRDYGYWKPTTDEGWNGKWLSVHVHDATTGKYLIGEVLSGRDGHFNVPSGGKHYVKVSGPDFIAWVLQGKEGRVVVTDKGPVLTAASQPQAKPSEARPVQGRKLTKEEWAELTKPEPVAKPSSVPGLPDGVEPVKKADGLPPGMTKGGK